MSVSAGKWCVLLLLLCLHAGLGAGKNCSDLVLNPKVVSDSESDGSTNQPVQVHCEEQYLLVPEDLDTVTCDTTTGDWTQPQCQPIPSVQFPLKPVSQDMKIQVLNIPVTLSQPVVREFDIDVSVTSHESGNKPPAVEITHFRLNTTSLHMTEGMKKANVTVTLIDKGDIGETKTFQLCLAIAKNESVDEERALMERSCIYVSINNTYKECDPFETSSLGPNLEAQTFYPNLTVGCKPGFLLVPEGLNYIICNKTTGKWTEQPLCQPIPMVEFSSESEIHNMNEGDINLIVTLTPPVVREFCVNVSVNITGESEGPTMAVNDKDFNLKTTMLHLAKGSNESMVAVGLMDTKVSGRTKTFRLCLTLAVNESVIEKRAILSKKRRCIDVSITNTYDTSLSLINESHIFTNKSRSLGFIVGYRTCDILLDLTLTLIYAESEEEELFADVTIPQTCQPEGVCVVELSSFAFSREQIGEYSAVLTPSTDDCKITQDEITTTITLTLTPQEVEESGTFVKFKGQLKSVFFVNTTERSMVGGDGLVPLTYSQPPFFLFRLGLQISSDELDCQDFVPVTLHVDVDPDKPCESINITSFLVESIDSGCSGSTTYTQFSLSLKAMTSPSVAIATGTVHVRVKYFVSVWFQEKDNRVNEGLPHIVINTTRRIDDLNDYIVVLATGTAGEKEWDIMWNWDKSWSVVIPSDIDILTTLTLTLTLTLRLSDDVIELKKNNDTATYTTGTEVSFERDSYTTREIKVNSTRALHKYQLSELVTITLTSSTDEDADLDPYSQTLKLNITPNDDEGHTWLLTIPDYPHSVILTLELEAKNKDIVKIGIKKCEVTFAHEEEEAPHPVPVPVPPRSKFSFTAMVVVFIFFVVLAVVVYVAFSKRDQLMEWVRSAGGEEGGGGTGVLSKARKRLRSRGAYKKLPTSVQDAMSMRHTD